MFTLELFISNFLRRGLESFDGASQGAHDLRTKLRKHLKNTLDENQVGLPARFDETAS
jgi:hypothetical protein